MHIKHVLIWMGLILLMAFPVLSVEAQGTNVPSMALGQQTYWNGYFVLETNAATTNFSETFQRKLEETSRVVFDDEFYYLESEMMWAETSQRDGYGAIAEFNHAGKNEVFSTLRDTARESVVAEFIPLAWEDSLILRALNWTIGDTAEQLADPVSPSSVEAETYWNNEIRSDESRFQAGLRLWRTDPYIYGALRLGDLTLHLRAYGDPPLLGGDELAKFEAAASLRLGHSTFNVGTRYDLAERTSDQRSMEIVASLDYPLGRRGMLSIAGDGGQRGVGTFLACTFKFL